MTCEDVPIGVRVPLHLRVYTQALWEDDVSSPHGTNCNLDGSETVKTGKPAES